MSANVRNAWFNQLWLINIFIFIGTLGHTRYVSLIFISLSFVFGRREMVSEWGNTHFVLPRINDLRKQIHDRACSQSQESPSLHVWARAGGDQSGAATVCLETTFLPVKVPYDSQQHRDTPAQRSPRSLSIKETVIVAFVPLVQILQRQDSLFQW